MEWSQIAPYFEPDGSLLDIYILETSLVDWAKVWAYLLASPHSLEFSINGELTPAPLDVGEAFRLRPDRSAFAVYALGKQRLNCHFFTEVEVEFSLDPCDVDGPSEAYRLVQFLTELGRATLKEVRLTAENVPHAVIARYEPTKGQVVWIPAKTWPYA